MISIEKNHSQRVSQNPNTPGAKFDVLGVIVFRVITWNSNFYISRKLLFKIITMNSQFTTLFH